MSCQTPKPSSGHCTGKRKKPDNGGMSLHIMGFTEKEFFDSVGGNSERIMNALQAA
jgi:hypothetical protein